jgi:ABC-type uncharacterized transport system auxiliary subunit
MFLVSCVSLPGENATAAAQYMLKGPAMDCRDDGQPLALRVIKVSAGLDSDRIARRDQGSGQFTYLRGVRWVDSAGAMLEQRLAGDLECKGFSVITSHHTQLNNDQLVCEVRALNLTASGGTDSADVALSCVLFKSGKRQQETILTSHSSTLRSWAIDDAMDAMANSYAKVLEDLSSRL